ncbi:MAG: PepSY-associated TM helix domain-containing protein [Bacteroidota bacterium]
MSTPKKRSSAFNKKLWSIHSWVGLYAGVVIAVLSVTGVLALYKVEVDRTLNASLFETAPGPQPVPISAVVDSLRSVHGAEYHTQTYPPKQAADTWKATFIIPSGLAFEQLEVFIDPYSGHVLGERDYTRSFAYFLRTIHVRLYESLFGRQIVGLAGIALLLSTITGFWIYGRFMKNQLLAAIRTKNLRIKMADYHKLIGVATLVFNLMIAITGAWLGLQRFVQPVVVGDRPGGFEVAEKPLTEAEDLAFAVDYGRVVQTSALLFPEFVPHFIQSSRDGSRTLRIMGDVPGAAYERHTFSLTLDKHDLSELHRYDIREAPVGEKLFYLQESMHFGDFGGIALKLLYSFFGITSGFLSLSGFVVYLKRTERKRSNHPTFVELKPLLLRWTYGILGVCAVLAVLQLNFGPVIPAILVIIAVYGTLLVLLIRALVLFVRSRFAKVAVS